MSYKKILLVNLLSHEERFFGRRTVLRAGLGYIAQALEECGIDYAVEDLALGYSLGHLIEHARTYQPDAIGVTLFTYRYLDAYALLRSLKKHLPDIPVIAGGPHITASGITVLQECEAIDIGISGEGEEVFPRICRGEAPSTVPGIMYRDGGEVRFSGERARIKDLNALAFPRYSHFDLDRYPVDNMPAAERDIPIITSRGCPYDCIYCPVQTAIGHEFRYRNVASVLEELRYWYGRGYRRFSFIDDNFTLLKQRIVELCDEILSSSLKDLRMSLPNEVRADKVDAPLLELMYRAGFRHLGFGVEAGNDRILKALKKHESMATIEHAISAAVSIGYQVDLFFIIGSPGETERDVEDSIAIATRYKVASAFFFNLIPYPGTELFDWIHKHGKFIYHPSHYLNRINSSQTIPVFSTPEFSADARRQMLRKARAAVAKAQRDRYVARLTRRGLPRIIASPVARLYAIPVIQRLWNDTPILKTLKRAILP